MSVIELLKSARNRTSHSSAEKCRVSAQRFFEGGGSGHHHSYDVRYDNNAAVPAYGVRLNCTGRLCCEELLGIALGLEEKLFSGICGRDGRNNTYSNPVLQRR